MGRHPGFLRGWEGGSLIVVMGLQSDGARVPREHHDILRTSHSLLCAILISRGSNSPSSSRYAARHASARLFPSSAHVATQPIVKGGLAGTASSIAVSMASRLLLNLRRSSARASSRPLASVPAAPAREIAFAPNPALARTDRQLGWAGGGEGETGGKGLRIEQVWDIAGPGGGKVREQWEMNDLEGRGQW